LLIRVDFQRTAVSKQFRDVFVQPGLDAPRGLAIENTVSSGCASNAWV
jgi:hypothetical protein